MDDDSREVGNVSVGSVLRYFQLRGWHEVENGSTITPLYRLVVEGGQIIEIALPRTRQLSDADRLISDAIRTVSQLDDKEPSSILDDINSIGFDRIKTVIPNELVQFDSINLNMAQQFIHNARRLFTATATTEMAPAPSFGRVMKEAKAYSERCRFGHTFRGSFGFTIESPVGRNDEPTLSVVEQTAPFERRVMQRLARGFQRIREAESTEDPSLVARNFREGFSANMCDALGDLLEQTSDRLQFRFAWSPEWLPSADVAQVESYSTKPVTLSIIREAAHSMRNVYVPQTCTVIGQVTHLRSEHNPADLLDLSSPREIMVEGTSEQVPTLKVKVVLSPADYIIAVEAHKSGRLVTVTGQLEQRKRGWFLNFPREFFI